MMRAYFAVALFASLYSLFVRDLVTADNNSKRWKEEDTKDLKLAKKKHKCLGKEVDMGRRKTLKQCYHACVATSSMFLFGVAPIKCNKDGCECFCIVSSDRRKGCISGTRNHLHFNLYKYATKKPDRAIVATKIHNIATEVERNFIDHQLPDSGNYNQTAHHDYDFTKSPARLDWEQILDTETIFSKGLKSKLGYVNHGLDEVAKIHVDEMYFQHIRGWLNRFVLLASHSNWRTSLNAVGNMVSKMMKFSEIVVGSALPPALQSIIVHIGRLAVDLEQCVRPLPSLKTWDEVGISYIESYDFVNWGENVQKKPRYMFFPKTVQQVKWVVQYAKKEELPLRVSAVRYTWQDVYADDDAVQVSLLPINVTTAYYPRDYETELLRTLDDWKSDFRDITIESSNETHANVTVGAAVMNIDFLRWSKNNRWEFPTNVFVLMNTYAGIISSICHGAEKGQKTVSDLVVGVEFVNAKGEVQRVTDPVMLKSVSGSLGLIGVITSITFQLNAMTYARLDPIQIPSLTLQRNPYPEKIEKLINENYHAEFFWFPSQGKTQERNFFWKNDGSEKDVMKSISKASSTNDMDMKKVVNSLVTIVNMFPEHKLLNCTSHGPKFLLSQVIALKANYMLPADAITMPLPEALHLKGGFNPLLVHAIEMNIPIPSLADGSADLGIISRAWRDATKLIRRYEIRDSGCRRFYSLEARPMGSSDVTLAPQRGNKHGTLSIEVLATMLIDSDIWNDFKKDFANVMLSYTDYDGTLLNVRPHWAKHWPSAVKVNGVEIDAVQHWRDRYREDIKKFLKDLSNLSKDVTIDDIEKQFANKHYGRLIFGRSYEQQSREQSLRKPQVE